MYCTGFAIDKAIEDTILIHPCPAFTMLAFIKHTSIRTEFTLDCLRHKIIIKLQLRKYGKKPEALLNCIIWVNRQGIAFERIYFADSQISKKYKNKEAKASEFRLCRNENERKCCTLPVLFLIHNMDY
jgi:hypothetical protein